MNICIIEDNRQLLENLCLVLGEEPGFSVRGSYGSAEDALLEFPWKDADVMLVDLDLPGMSGLELIRKIALELPHLQILVYTISEDSETVFGALKAGALGYLLKGCSASELIDSLHSINAGGAPMSPRIARKVIRDMQHPSTAPDSDLLTQREKDILVSLSQGKTYKEMGESFNVSPNTIHAHIKHVYAKLHAATRADAIQKARRLGVIWPEQGK
jgi:two-component system NarL family response regulator